MNWLAWIVIGGIAGWIASIISDWISGKTGGHDRIDAISER